MEDDASMEKYCFPAGILRLLRKSVFGPYFLGVGCVCVEECVGLSLPIGLVLGGGDRNQPGLLVWERERVTWWPSLLNFICLH